MARPKNKQSIQRTHDIHIRCSEMEYEIVSGYAESAGLKIKDTMKSNATITLSATIPWMLPIMV